MPLLIYQSTPETTQGSSNRVYHGSGFFHRVAKRLEGSGIGGKNGVIPQSSEGTGGSVAQPGRASGFYPEGQVFPQAGSIPVRPALISVLKVVLLNTPTTLH